MDILHSFYYIMLCTESGVTPDTVLRSKPSNDWGTILALGNQARICDMQRKCLHPCTISLPFYWYIPQKLWAHIIFKYF